MVCVYDESKTGADAVIAAVEKAGFGAAELAERERTAEPKKEKAAAGDGFTAIRTRLWVSIVFLALLMYVSMGHMLGLPLPGLPARHTKRAAVRLSAISADAAGAVRQPQILFQRLSGAGAPRTEHGLARGRRLGGGDAVRRHRHLYDRRGSRARRLGHGRALPHQPVL